MAGRRSKYTPELAEKIASAIRLGLTQKDASLIAGIDETTFIRWEHRNANFASLIAQAKAQRAGRWLGKIQEAAATDWRAAAELLDRCSPDYRKSLQLTGEGGGPILFDPGWSQVRAAIAAALAPYPDAIADLDSQLTALEAGGDD